jgi:putative ABC transport system permease protein
LGIGACTAIFSIVDAVLLRSMPYPESDRIVHLREVNERGVRIRVAEPNYLDVRTRNRSFQSVAQFAGGEVVVSGTSEPVRTRTFWVSGEYSQPLAGRTFLPDESKPGGDRVAVVSYGFWQRLLNGRQDFSGTKLNVDGVVFTVVGIMPPGFSYPPNTEIWVPREIGHPRSGARRHQLHWEPTQTGARPQYRCG